MPTWERSILSWAALCGASYEVSRDRRYLGELGFLSCRQWCGLCVSSSADDSGEVRWLLDYLARIHGDCLVVDELQEVESPVRRPQAPRMLLLSDPRGVRFRTLDHLPPANWFVYLFVCKARDTVTWPHRSHQLVLHQKLSVLFPCYQCSLLFFQCTTVSAYLLDICLSSSFNTSRVQCKPLSHAFVASKLVVVSPARAFLIDWRDGNSAHLSVSISY